MEHYQADIPAELVTNVTAICGESGREWLSDLPRIVGHIEKKWDVHVAAPFPGIEFNFVAPAVRPTGEQVVVKLAPPSERPEIFCEAKWIRERDGDACVRLLDIERDSHAILLERLSPGMTLWQHFNDDPWACVRPAVDVLKRVLRAVPYDRSDVIDLDDWFAGMRRAAGTAFPADRSEKALAIYSNLSSPKEHTFYLHGDYHPGNVVSAAREPWAAIDAKGIAGHLGYEISVFLNNLHWWQKGDARVKEKLREAVDHFSSSFGISSPELRMWAYAAMILSAWWTFDETPLLYGNEVALADIWDV